MLGGALQNVATDTKLPGDNSPTTALVAGPNKEVIDATAAVAAASPANDLVDADVALTRGADVRLTLLTATRRERPSRPATGLLGQSGIGRTGEGGSIQRRRTHCS